MNAREDFIQHGETASLLQMFIQINLTVIFRESVELLTILCSIPIKTVESEIYFSTFRPVMGA